MSFKTIVVKKLEEWTDWLEENHEKEKKVGLISYKKHTGKSSISHKEAMHEAICFGWIDTTIKKLDEDRYVRYFVKRGDKANWSLNTLEYGKNLLASGKMRPQGLQRYKEGLKKKPLDHDIPKKPDMPEELKKELVKSQRLKDFERLSESKKNGFYRYILRAKTEATRKKRVNEILGSLK